MNCKHCGAELLDTAKVCDVCGAPVERDATSLMDFYEEVGIDEDGGVDVYFVPSDPAAESESETKGIGPLRLSRRGIAIAACSAALLVFVVILVVTLLLPHESNDANPAPDADQQVTTQTKDTTSDTTKDNRNEESDRESHTEFNAEARSANEVDVVLPVEVNSNDLDAGGSRIPLQITGTLEDGTPVDRHGYVEADGSGLHLAPGTYAIHAIGSPISAEGALYHFTEGVLHVTIPGPDGMDAQVEGERIVLTRREEGDATEDTVEHAREFILGDTRKDEQADRLAQRARERYL